MNLKNKKILITGATGGIGNSLVKKFYDLDSNIIATGTNEQKLNSLKKNYPNLKNICLLLKDSDVKGCHVKKLIEHKSF